MGELFTSFDDAWSHFLRRTDALESFFDQFPDDDAFELEGWLIVPPPEVKREALRLQAELEEVAGLEIVPHHFLHVWLNGPHGAAVHEVAEGGPFDVVYGNVNCLHTAVVVEAWSERLDAVVAPPTFLPHMTIAVVRGSPPVDPVRDAVVPLRSAACGRGVVRELVRVRVPAGRDTVLQPWRVIERLRLRR